MFEEASHNWQSKLFQLLSLTQVEAANLVALLWDVCVSQINQMSEFKSQNYISWHADNFISLLTETINCIQNII
jgi:hypothetical protein